MSETKTIQGKIIEHNSVTDADGHIFSHVRLEKPDGTIEDFHVHRYQVNFHVGDVIRALVFPPTPHIRDSFSLVNKEGIEYPQLSNIANLGKVDIGTTERSHYEFGEEITGKVIENTGQADAMDMMFYFAVLELTDGKRIEVSLERSQQIGTWITGTVGNSVFSQRGDNKKDLLSLGFGNLGGMPMLRHIRQVPPPGTTPEKSGVVTLALGDDEIQSRDYFLYGHLGFDQLWKNTLNILTAQPVPAGADIRIESAKRTRLARTIREEIGHAAIVNAPYGRQGMFPEEARDLIIGFIDRTLTEGLLKNDSGVALSSKPALGA